jgi:hypothetical protein
LQARKSTPNISSLLQKWLAITVMLQSGGGLPIVRRLSMVFMIVGMAVQPKVPATLDYWRRIFFARGVMEVE